VYAFVLSYLRAEQRRAVHPPERRQVPGPVGDGHAHRHPEPVRLGRRFGQDPRGAVEADRFVLEHVWHQDLPDRRLVVRIFAGPKVTGWRVVHSAEGPLPEPSGRRRLRYMPDQQLVADLADQLWEADRARADRAADCQPSRARRG
jgi:hypothetical protein